MFATPVESPAESECPCDRTFVFAQDRCSRLRIPTLGRTGTSCQSPANVWADPMRCQARTDCAHLGGGLWRGRNRHTALMLAAGSGHARAVELLIEAGSELDAKDDLG